MLKGTKHPCVRILPLPHCTWHHLSNLVQLPDTLERLNSNKLIMMMTPSLCTQSNENLLPLDGDEMYSSPNSWNILLFSYQPSGIPEEYSSHFWLLTIHTASSQSLEIARASWCFPWQMEGGEGRARVPEVLFHPGWWGCIFGKICPNHAISEGFVTHATALD